MIGSLMIEFLIFIIGEGFLDYLTLRSKGNFLSMIFCVAAFGFAIIAIPLVITPTVTTSAQLVVSSPSGNYTMNPYNQTSSIPPSLVPLVIWIGYGNALIQFGLIVLTVGFMFFERRKKRRERYSR